MEKQRKNEKCVLGLATGSSPLSIYKELIRMHKEDGLSFHNVITFNLDEYYPISSENLESYHTFMYENLFNHIDIDRDNINIPRGDLKKNEIEKYCNDFEEKIKKLDIEPIIKSVVDDFNNIYKLKRGINISYSNDGKNKYLINGIENRIEQIVANLLDNAISFSGDNKDVIVKVSKLENDKVSINILDEGQGFKEKDTNKIFKRFYSNRPDKFGQHSGLGLNIVKNLVDLHNATIRASNRLDKKGASMEIIFPNA